MSDIAAPTHHIEVFLVFIFYKKWHHHESEALLSLSVSTLYDNISKTPLFFNKESLVSHMRFIDASYCIVRAYVADAAIEGYVNGLFLKKDQLKIQQIHGYFVSSEEDAEYITNPAFDETLLASVRESEEFLD